ncbi:hypothetical protein HDV00_003772 [Rhizophlyctis rosea]|nr:hypothetical protein HDV00_003772 [Rhizophlyctis rosea]
MVEPRVGSLDNAHHIPGGGNVQTFEERLNFKKKAKSRVGSLENIHHHPGGGKVRIVDEKPHFRERAHSKVGSLENIHHIPGGGYRDTYLSDGSRTPASISPEPTALPKLSSANPRLRSSFDTTEAKAYVQMWNYYEPGLRRASAAPSSTSRVALDVDVESSFRRRKSVPSKVGSLDNIHHRPGGGQKKIFDERVAPKFRNVGSKVGSLENIAYAPPASQVQIVDVPLRWRAHSKVGSLENINHVPLGGHVTIVDEPVVYRTARAAQ